MAEGGTCVKKEESKNKELKEKSKIKEENEKNRIEERWIN